MAIVKMTAAQAKASARVDHTKVDATTEDDIRAHMTEDGFDPDDPFLGLTATPSVIRKKLGLSQEKFAGALRIPAATLRNWEQGRTRPDPVALSFFALVADNPKKAIKILGGASQKKKAAKSGVE